MAKHGPPMGFGIASLQIAIALASVCLITKRRSLWAASALWAWWGSPTSSTVSTSFDQPNRLGCSARAIAAGARAA